MSDYDWVRYYPADYMRDTRRLSQREHGAYCLLLVEYYLAGEPLPDDDRVLMRMSLSDTLSDWLAIRSAISGFFEIRDGKWFHHKCDREIATARERVQARRRGAVSTNEKRRQASLSDTLSASLSDTHSDTRSASLKGSLIDPKPEPESEPELESLPPSIPPVGGEVRARRSAARPKFVPPTGAEVAAHFRAKGWPMEQARGFYHYFATNGWRVGRAGLPMVSWTSAAAQWMVRARKDGDVPASTPMDDPLPALPDHDQEARAAAEAQAHQAREDLIATVMASAEAARQRRGAAHEQQA